MWFNTIIQVHISQVLLNTLLPLFLDLLRSNSLHNDLMSGVVDLTDLTSGPPLATSGKYQSEQSKTRSDR